MQRGADERLRREGVVDLLRMKAYVGPESREEDVPADLQDEAEALRGQLIEAMAKIAVEAGRAVASPAEARVLLGLRTGGAPATGSVSRCAPGSAAGC